MRVCGITKGLRVIKTSIFIDFCWIWEPSWLSKTEPRRSKIDVERASKFDQFLKASWNAILSTQEAPRRASAADRSRRWSRPGLLGEDLGGGKPDVQAPRTFESRTGPKKICGKFEEDLVDSSSTPSRDGRRIVEGSALVPPRQFFRIFGSLTKRKVENRSLVGDGM